MSERFGVLFVDKPSGLTSFQTLNRIKKIADTPKVGHAGTLDKFATGLLVVATGWCTRLMPWFTGLDKRYSATVRFGEETETLDPEGDVIATADLPNKAQVSKAIERFLGPISQVPPIYSAVHASGERAYKLARAGKEVDLKARDVEIYRIEMHSFDAPEMVIGVHCSKGTYIRSLARDIGIEADSRAHLAELRRTQIGPFLIDEAKTPDQIDLKTDLIDPAGALSRIGGLQQSSVSPEILRSIRNGQVISSKSLDEMQLSDGEIMITERSGKLAAIMEKKGDVCRYLLVVPVQTNSTN